MNNKQVQDALHKEAEKMAKGFTNEDATIADLLIEFAKSKAVREFWFFRINEKIGDEKFISKLAEIEVPVITESVNRRWQCYSFDVNMEKRVMFTKGYQAALGTLNGKNDKAKQKEKE